jgi:hypothetical protein
MPTGLVMISGNPTHRLYSVANPDAQAATGFPSGVWAMIGSIMPLVIGFVLTIVLGGLLGTYLSSTRSTVEPTTRIGRRCWRAASTSTTRCSTSGTTG